MHTIHIQATHTHTDTHTHTHTCTRTRTHTLTTPLNRSSQRGRRQTRIFVVVCVNIYVHTSELCRSISIQGFFLQKKKELIAVSACTFSPLFFETLSFFPRLFLAFFFKSGCRRHSPTTIRKTVGEAPTSFPPALHAECVTSRELNLAT